jgi:hypothetical protein
VITGTGDETGVVIVSNNPITVDGSALSTTAVNGLTLSGSGAITATVGPSALKIDASTATGKLVLTGNAATATITGGSGADIITSGGASDTLTGGAGLDTIVAGAGTDTVVIGNTADSLDTIIGFTGGAGGDKIQLDGTTAASGKTVAQITNTTVTGNATENTVVTLSPFTSAAVGTVTVAGLVITSNGTSAFTAANIVSVLTGGSVTGLSLSGSLTTGWTIAATPSQTTKVTITSSTANSNVSDLTLGAANTGAGTLPSGTVTQGSAGTSTLYVGAANEIVFDTSAHLGTLGVSIGNVSTAAGASTHVAKYAVASDTGEIYYDADGNWTSGSVQIGTIGVVTGLTAANFTVA